jgi:hypothetical protein
VEVPYLNLALVIGYLDFGFYDFPQPLDVNAGIVPQNKP